MAMSPTRRSAFGEPEGDGDHAMALPGEAIHQGTGIAGQLRRLGDNFECPLDDAALGSVLIDDKGFRALGRRIERNEPHEPLGRTVRSGFGGCPNGRVDRVLIRLGTRQRRQRQHAVHGRTRPAATTSTTSNSLRVSVPVLSAHRTSMAAASCTADSRVSRTPRRASVWAPNAADSVNVAGSAAGIVASSTVRPSGIRSLGGNAVA